MNTLKQLAKYRMVLSVIAVVVFGLMLVPSTSFAANSCEKNSDCTTKGYNCTGAEGSKACTKSAEDTFGLGKVDKGLEQSLGNKDLRETVGQLINVALGLLGIIAVVIILIGGFQWMTAGGNDDKAAEARKRIFAGIIGLAIILSAWAIALFVLNQLSKATESGTISSDFTIQ